LYHKKVDNKINSRIEDVKYIRKITNCIFIRMMGSGIKIPSKAHEASNEFEGKAYAKHYNDAEEPFRNSHVRCFNGSQEKPSLVEFSELKHVKILVDIITKSFRSSDICSGN